MQVLQPLLREVLFFLEVYWLLLHQGLRVLRVLWQERALLSQLLLRRATAKRKLKNGCSRGTHCLRRAMRVCVRVRMRLGHLAR